MLDDSSTMPVDPPSAIFDDNNQAGGSEAGIRQEERLSPFLANSTKSLQSNPTEYSQTTNGAVPSVAPTNIFKISSWNIAG